MFVAFQSKRVVAVLALTLGLPVMANTKEAISLSEMALADLLQLEVTVSSLHDEQLLTTPSSVTVFTRERIKKMGVHSVEELLNYVPGFQATRETFLNQGYRVGARGLLTPQPSYSILFLIDGQRLNTDLSAGALYSHRMLTTANIEKIEVIRGPGSALYGSSAFSGVVNIITTKDANEAYFAAGNHDAREASINVSDQGEHIDFTGFVRYYTDSGQAYGADLTTPVDSSVTGTSDPYDALDAQVTVSWRDKVTLSARHSDRTLKEFFDFRLVTPGVPEATTQQDSIGLQWKLIDDVDQGIDLQLRYVSASMTTVDELGPLVGIYEYENSEWELKVDGRKDFDNHSLRGGLSMRDASVDSYEFEALPSGLIIPQGETTNRDILGAYVQSQSEFTPEWRATLGLRFDKISDLDLAVSPRLAVVYTPGITTAFKFMYGEAFRAPNRLQTDDVFIGNQDIESEDIRTVEIAWLQDYKDMIWGNLSLQSTATLFHSTHEKRIALMPGGFFGVIAGNVDSDLETSGLELELNASYGHGLSSYISYTYLPKTEENPRNFSSNSFSVITQYDADKWFSSLHAYYRGGMEHLTGPPAMRETIKIDGYWNVGFSIGRKISEKMLVRVNISNLLDKQYYSPSTVAAFPKGLENRGRTFMLGMEYQL